MVTMVTIIYHVYINYDILEDSDSALPRIQTL